MLHACKVLLVGWAHAHSSAEDACAKYCGARKARKATGSADMKYAGSAASSLCYIEPHKSRLDMGPACCCLLHRSQKISVPSLCLREGSEPVLSYGLLWRLLPARSHPLAIDSLTLLRELIHCDTPMVPHLWCKHFSGRQTNCRQAAEAWVELLDCQSMLKGRCAQAMYAKRHPLQSHTPTWALEERRQLHVPLISPSQSYCLPGGQTPSTPPAGLWGPPPG